MKCLIKIRKSGKEVASKEKHKNRKKKGDIDVDYDKGKNEAKREQVKSRF